MVPASSASSDLDQRGLWRWGRPSSGSLRKCRGTGRCPLWVHFRTSANVTAMSAFPPMATKLRTSREVRFVPTCDINRSTSVQGRSADTSHEISGCITSCALNRKWASTPGVMERRYRRSPNVAKGASNVPVIVASSRHFPRSSCPPARGEIHRQRPDRYRPDQSSQTILERNAPAKPETLGCAHYPQ